MKKLSFFLFFTFFISHYLMGQIASSNSEEIEISHLISGTLLVPQKTSPVPLAIIIAGSGPTDRDGNQPMMKNNSLRFLAEELVENDIATFRYDKRLIKLIQTRNIVERNIRFGDFIEDAIDVLHHFKNDERFSKIFIIGHSQGSLIGMIAAKEGADGFISIAGAGQEIDDVIVDQLEAQAPQLKESARIAFDDLRSNGYAAGYDPGLASILRKEIQPFLLTWMQYDPKEEIKKLNIPVLLINGDKDFQVQLSELELLAKAKPDGQKKIIRGMNHILKKVDDMGLENQKTYNIHHLPIIPELTAIISKFIHKNSSR